MVENYLNPYVKRLKQNKTKQRKRNRKGDFLKAKMGEHKKHERIKQKQI